MVMSTEDLNGAVEFDCPFTVDENGELGASHEYVPEVFGIEATEHNEPDLEVGGDWTALSGYTGQDRYNGPVMHNSEYLGGRMAQDILDEPGTYVLVPVLWEQDVRDESWEQEYEVEGWVVLRKNTETKGDLS